MKVKNFYIFLIILFTNLSSYSQITEKQIDLLINQVDSLANLGFGESLLPKCDSILSYSRMLKYKKGTAQTYYRKALIYENSEKYKLALENLKYALTIYEELKNDYQTSKILLNIGKIYSDLNEDKIAISYYFKAEKVAERIKENSVISTSYNNIANSYQHMQQFVQSHYYLKKSLAISLALNDSLSIARVYHNIGVNYEITNSNDSALHYFQKSLSFLNPLDEDIGHAYNYLEIGIVYLKLDKVSKAEKIVLKCLEVVNKKKLLSIQNDVYPILSDIYEKKKDYKLAYEYHKKYANLKIADIDSKDKKDIVKKEIEDEYIKQREIQNKIAEQKQIYARAEIKAQKNLTNYAIIALVILLGLIIIVFKSNFQKNKANRIISMQKSIVEHKQKEILDSINYAKYIQDALLPDELLIHSLNAFVLFKPKDIVSGDFYWYYENKFGGNNGEIATYFAVADCTGHGVPGALVSVLGNNGLNSCVKEFKIADTNLILDKLTEIVEDTFKKSQNQLKDGMDISIVKLVRSNNSKTVNVQWSGANNPIWIITKNGEFSEIKANKQPIGSFDNKVSFSKHEFELEKGDRIYLFTDGYADQFGGPKEKKYRYKQLSDYLISTNNLSLQLQK